MNEFVKRYHTGDEPRIPFRQIITPGSQDALTKLMEAMLSPGDYLVTEEHVYSGLLAAVCFPNFQFQWFCEDNFL
jgi:DNA-binding transcriptional MocR family regulator